jgi:hypothetical protein
MNAITDPGPASPNGNRSLLDEKSPSAKSNVAEERALSATQPHPAISPSQSEPQFRASGTLAELREAGWRERLKGATVLLLDGKHAGVTGVFRSWSGTVAYIEFDHNHEKVGISIQRRVGVLKR